MSFAVTGERVAYLGLLPVGDALREVPAFLTGEHYIRCPLEEAYRTARGPFPPHLRGPLL